MNIRVDLNYPIKDGAEVVFRSPVDCSQVTGLKVYFVGEDGNTTSQEFAFADAHGNNVGDIPNLFAENVVVKVILDVTTGMAFVQNADTNAYLEGRFADIPGRRIGTGAVFNDTAKNKAGEMAVAFGEETKALGKGSFTAGAKNTASGRDDLLYTEAIGTGSMASGMGAVAFSRASKSFGYRTQTGYPPDASWIENRYGVTVQTDADGNNIFPADNEGQAAVAMGADTVAVANHSFAGGQKSKAFGLNSFTYGTEAVTRGKNAVAMGSHTEADEECATAFGASSKAKGKWSFAVGEHTEAMGNCSAAIGHGTITATGSPGYSQMVVGRYNAYKNGECDSKLFVVGNGSNEDSRSNAFTVDRYGNAVVKGKLSFGSVDDASAQMVRGIESGNALPSKGNFNGQIFMLEENVSEEINVWKDKITVYIWSDAFDVGWIKIGEKTADIGIGIE